MTAKVLVLDNRDSFVFNLVDEFRSRGAWVRTLRSNLTLEALASSLQEMDPHLVVLSPGPGRPEDGGVMVEWLHTDPKVPVLGICLGHQALAVASGGDVGRAPFPVHGRADRIVVIHENGKRDALLAPLAPSFDAARYHSLVVTRVPSSYRVIAATEETPALVMAMRHRERPRVGLQFHPESILTPAGRGILVRLLHEASSSAEGGQMTLSHHQPDA